MLGLYLGLGVRMSGLLLVQVSVRAQSYVLGLNIIGRPLLAQVRVNVRLG